MSRWTAADIPDQSGKTAIVTGASSGLGLVVAGELARRGATTVLACRDVAKGEAAADRIKGNAEVIRLDLADLASVRSFAETMTERLDRVDILVNNAGVMALPRRTTADGFEMQFGTNHLGHFALTGLLLPLLLGSESPRVVTVSSGAHRGGRINFNDLHGERRYFSWAAYGSSKLANLLFAFELQRRAEGTGLISAGANPGYAATGLQTRTGIRFNDVMGALGNATVAMKAEQGALSLLYAATVPDLPGGSYVGPHLELWGYPKLARPSRAARDEAAARRLWEVSEEQTGVTYAFPK